MARRTSKEELQTYKDQTVPDVIGPDLKAVFCGINPSLSTARDQAHFATPGNRFWPSLHRSGFTPELLHPSEKEKLLGLGLGVTNVVRRATASAAELKDEEYPKGVERLRRLCVKHRPKCLAFLGIGAYRVGFGDKKATLGPQDRTLGPTRLYVLPNPSGLNAHYSPDMLAELFREFRAWVESL